MKKKNRATNKKEPAHIGADLRRIDQMLTAVYPAALKGDHDSIHIVLTLWREREIIEKKLVRQESFAALAPVEEEDE